MKREDAIRRFGHYYMTDSWPQANHRVREYLGSRPAGNPHAHATLQEAMIVAKDSARAELTLAKSELEARLGLAHRGFFATLFSSAAERAEIKSRREKDKSKLSRLDEMLKTSAYADMPQVLPLPDEIHIPNPLQAGQKLYLLYGAYLNEDLKFNEAEIAAVNIDCTVSNTGKAHYFRLSYDIRKDDGEVFTLPHDFEDKDQMRLRSGVYGLSIFTSPEHVEKFTADLAAALADKLAALDSNLSKIRAGRPNPPQP